MNWYPVNTTPGSEHLYTCITITFKTWDWSFHSSVQQIARNLRWVRLNFPRLTGHIHCYYNIDFYIYNSSYYKVPTKCINDENFPIYSIHAYILIYRISYRRTFLYSVWYYYCLKVTFSFLSRYLQHKSRDYKHNRILNLTSIPNPV